jgi:hypothetical protein
MTSRNGELRIRSMAGPENTYRMRAAGHDAARPILDHGIGGIDDRPGGIDHVIGQQHIAPGDIADDM